jgi:hypothetical protein
MATIEYCIQIENHAWDVAPNNIDRITGQDMSTISGCAAPVDKGLVSPVTGVTPQREESLTAAQTGQRPPRRRDIDEQLQ